MRPNSPAPLEKASGKWAHLVTAHRIYPLHLSHFAPEIIPNWFRQMESNVIFSFTFVQTAVRFDLHSISSDYDTIVSEPTEANFCRLPLGHQSKRTTLNKRINKHVWQINRKPSRKTFLNKLGPRLIESYNAG